MQLGRHESQSRFELLGIVGRIFEKPHQRYVGSVVVVEVHTVDIRAKVRRPWYVCFKNRVAIESLKTGDKVSVWGVLEQTSFPDDAVGIRGGAKHLRPGAVFLWGESWKHEVGE